MQVPTTGSSSRHAQVTAPPSARAGSRVHCGRRPATPPRSGCRRVPEKPSTGLTFAGSGRNTPSSRTSTVKRAGRSSSARGSGRPHRSGAYQATPAALAGNRPLSGPMNPQSAGKSHEHAWEGAGKIQSTATIATADTSAAILTIMELRRARPVSHMCRFPLVRGGKAGLSVRVRERYSPTVVR